MLVKLFGSNSRVKILKQFLLNPGEKYYIRQLARDLGLQVNSVRRELENLEEFGLLSSKVSDESAEGQDEFCLTGIKNSPKKPVKTTSKAVNMSDKKYFKANLDFPLFEDVKTLIIKSQILHKDALTKDLLKICKPRLLILTGMFVNRLDMGIDMLIVGRVSKDKMKTFMRKLENDLGKEVNFTIMDPQEFKYRREIADMFLYSVLDGEKITIIDEIGI